MEKRRKLSYVKDVDADKGLVRGYVSTFDWDRDGDRFVQGAWQLDAFKSNPVVLWGHRHSDLPIGRCVDLLEDENGLFAVTEMDQESEQGARVLSLYNRGFLNAFSVGFMLKNYKVEQRGENEKGIAITEAELYEYSAVSVPANSGALVSRETAEIAMKAISPDIIEVLHTKSSGEKFLVVPINNPPAPAEPVNTDGFEPALKGIIEMARIAKGSRLTEDRMTLVTTAMSVFNDLLTEHKGHVTQEEMDRLGASMKEFAGVLQSVYPAAADQIGKTISQIEKASQATAE